MSSESYESPDEIEIFVVAVVTDIHPHDFRRWRGRDVGNLWFVSSSDDVRAFKSRPRAEARAAFLWDAMDSHASPFYGAVMVLRVPIDADDIVEILNGQADLGGEIVHIYKGWRSRPKGSVED